MREGDHVKKPKSRVLALLADKCQEKTQESTSDSEENLVEPLYEGLKQALPVVGVGRFMPNQTFLDEEECVRFTMRLVESEKKLPTFPFGPSSSAIKVEDQNEEQA